MSHINGFDFVGVRWLTVNVNKFPYGGVLSLLSLSMSWKINALIRNNFLFFGVEKFEDPFSIVKKQNGANWSLSLSLFLCDFNLPRPVVYCSDNVMAYYYKVAELDNFSLVVERKNNIKWRKIFFNFLWNKLSLDPQVPHT